MGKKKKSNKAKKTVQLKFKFFGFILSFLIVFSTLAFIANQPNKNLPCANSISCVNDLSGEPENVTAGEFEGSLVQPPTINLAEDVKSQAVLGESSSNKKIYIDLTNQKLFAKEGDTTVYEFPVSTGKWGKTPTGTFRIWIKLRYTRMAGGIKGTGTYYNLPNVPHTMYFYNDVIPKWRGYGVHGAYWHNNFGHPMSHGCVNVGLENAETLYHWATPISTKNTIYATDDNPGTEIIIYGVAPNS